jgi:hypothetical protein
VKEDKNQTVKFSEQFTIESKKSEVEVPLKVKELKPIESKKSKDSLEAKAKLAGIAMKALKKAYKNKNIVPRKKYEYKAAILKDE